MLTKHNYTYEWSRKILIHLSIAFDIDRFDVPPGTGTCLIVSAVGGKKGFVEETNLCFVRNSKSEDSHLEMNLAHFKDGLTEKVLSTIQKKELLL